MNSMTQNLNIIKYIVQYINNSNSLDNFNRSYYSIFIVLEMKIKQCYNNYCNNTIVIDCYYNLDNIKSQLLMLLYVTRNQIITLVIKMK